MSVLSVGCLVQPFVLTFMQNSHNGFALCNRNFRYVVIVVNFVINVINDASNVILLFLNGINTRLLMTFTTFSTRMHSSRMHTNCRSGHHEMSVPGG